MKLSTDTAEYLALFDPPSVPVRELLPSMAANALGPGAWTTISGLRWEYGNFVVRNGHVAVTASPVAGSSPAHRGDWSGYFNGAYTTFSAWRVGSETIIVQMTTNTFTEITSTTGAFGNTRFTTDGKVSFAVVNDWNDSRDVLVIQNGFDTPRVYTRDVSAVYTMAKHNAVVAPAPASLSKPLARWGASLIAGGTSSGVPTFSNTDTGGAAQTRLVGVMTGSSPDNNIRLTANLPVVGDKTELTWAASMSPGTARQLTLIVEGSYGLWWDALKVEIYNGSTYYTVHDPTDSKYSPVQVPMDSLPETNRYCMAFSLDEIGSANIGSITKMRLTWVESTLSPATTTLDIYCVAATGRVYGGAQHALVYNSSDSLAEGSTIILEPAETQRVKDLGGRPLDGLRIPRSTALTYVYRVFYNNTTTAQRDLGVDQVSIYRRDSNLEEFRTVFTETIADYAGSWTFTTGAELAVNYYTDNTAEDELGVRVPPGQSHSQMPVGKALQFCNHRLYLASKLTSGSQNLFSRLYVSCKDYPFRYTVLNSGDDSEGVAVNLAGEDIVGIAAVSASTYGAGTAYIISNRRTFASAGFSPEEISSLRMIGEYGTLSPDSIVVDRGAIYFVDQSMQVRRLYGGQFQNLSRQRVDVLLFDVPDGRRDDMTATVHRDLYQLGFSGPGSSVNDKRLLFNIENGRWEACDSMEISVEGLCVFTSGNTPKLYAFSSDAKVYELEQEGLVQDPGSSAIDVELETGEIHLSDWSSFFVDKVEMVTTCQPGTQWTITRTYQPSGLSASSVIDIGAETALSAWLVDGEVDTKGLNDWGVVLNFQASLDGGSVVRGIRALIQPTTGGAKVPS